MLFRQKLDTFIRTIGPYGYLVNQTTKHDRVFDSSGAVFLGEVSRPPPEELDAKDETFSYASENPKTFTFDFRQKEEDGLQVDDSQVFLDNYLRNNPSLLDFTMEVTSRCNERCIHCYIPHETKVKDIDFDFALQVIDQAAEAGVVHITLTGGEATIYPHLAELIRHARKRDLSVHLLSNLVSLPEDLLKTIVESHLALIQVSVYSLKPEEHDFVTQLPGSLKKTLANIEGLIAADVPVQISCPVMKVNYNSYKEVLTWAYDRKIKAYTDFIMMARTDGTTGNLDQRIGPEQAGGGSPPGQTLLTGMTGTTAPRVDMHAHLGQFYEHYYPPADVGAVLFDELGLEAAAVSSTSACENYNFNTITGEVDELGRLYPGRVFYFLCLHPGHLPGQEWAAETPVSVDGLKVHPYAQEWNDGQLDSAFSLADSRHVPMLIHTGGKPEAEPLWFIPFLKAHPRVPSAQGAIPGTLVRTGKRTDPVLRGRYCPHMVRSQCRGIPGSYIDR